MDKTLVFQRYYNLSLRFLSYRPRSKQEVYKYLKEKSKRAKGLDEAIIAKIMERLVELKFIDDISFSKFWLENRKKGFKILRQELIQKGVDKETIEEAASLLDMAGKEDKLIKNLIQKKQKSLSKYSKQKAYEKLVGFLLRRGFDYDKVLKSLKSG